LQSLNFNPKAELLQRLARLCPQPLGTKSKKSLLPYNTPLIEVNFLGKLWMRNLIFIILKAKKRPVSPRPSECLYLLPKVFSYHPSL
jgi:hypothetical protein